MTLIKGIVFLAKPSIIKKKDYSEKNLKIRGLTGALIGLGLMYCGYYPYWEKASNAVENISLLLF